MDSEFQLIRPIPILGGRPLDGLLYTHEDPDWPVMLVRYFGPEMLPVVRAHRRDLRCLDLHCSPCLGAAACALGGSSPPSLMVVARRRWGQPR